MSQTLEQTYQLRFDELNALVQTFSDTEGFFALSEKEAKRKFDECLFWFFVDGFESGILMSGLKVEMPNGYEYLDIKYPDGETVEEKFYKYFREKDGKHMKTLLESESHRMWNTGSLESIKESGDIRDNSAVYVKDVKKTWLTMKDEKVRDTHWMLEGQTIPANEEFVTADGDYGMAPGMFQTAENNSNCRCILRYGR